MQQRKKIKLTQRKRRKWKKAETRALNKELEKQKTSSSKDEEDDIKKEMTHLKEKTGVTTELVQGKQ